MIKIKKLVAVIVGIVFFILSKLVFRWEKAGLIGKSTTIILSLVFLIFGLASFYVAAPESITRAADVDINLTYSTDHAFCYDLGSCYTSGIGQRVGYRDGVDYGDIFDGYRFLNVTIPQGATIDDAYFKLTAFSNEAYTVDVKVWAEAADNGATFNTTTRTPKNATAGAVSVAWTIPNTTADVEYSSPDIKTVIQEVVNRVGWSSGNALIILVRNNGANNCHLFKSAYYVGAEPALAINYTVGAGPTRRIIIIQ